MSKKQAKIVQFVRPSDTDGRNGNAPIAQLVEHRTCNAVVVSSILTRGSPSKWAKTKYANMRRYVPSGKYFAHAKVNGHLVRSSLKTTSLEIAKVKLDRLLEQHRGRPKRNPKDDDTMGKFAKDYIAAVMSKGMKQRSKDYREETWEMVKRNWIALESTSAAAVTEQDVKDWVERMRRYSCSRFNGCLETLRGIFKTAIEAGACLHDPTRKVERAEIKIEAPHLPDSDTFKKMLKTLDGHGRKLPAAFTVRLLAYTGLRINEARHLAPEDVDLERGWITARVTKNGEVRRIPIIEEARPVLQQFIEGAFVIDPRRALRTVSGKTMTPHDLRHLFATRCLESGVDVRTVAGWLGHKDGGALLLKRYAHLLDGHSQRMAQKVRIA